MNLATEAFERDPLNVIRSLQTFGVNASINAEGQALLLAHHLNGEIDADVNSAFFESYVHQHLWDVLHNTRQEVAALINERVHAVRDVIANAAGNPTTATAAITSFLLFHHKAAVFTQPQAALLTQPLVLANLDPECPAEIVTPILLRSFSNAELFSTVALDAIALVNTERTGPFRTGGAIERVADLTHALKAWCPQPWKKVFEEKLNAYLLEHKATLAATELSQDIAAMLRRPLNEKDFPQDLQERSRVLQRYIKLGALHTLTPEFINSPSCLSCLSAINYRWLPKDAASIGPDKWDIILKAIDAEIEKDPYLHPLFSGPYWGMLGIPPEAIPNWYNYAKTSIESYTEDWSEEAAPEPVYAWLTQLAQATIRQRAQQTTRENTHLPT